MSIGSRSTEDLARMYVDQSVGSFTSMAMSAPIEDKPVEERKFVNRGCTYPCCNDKGNCKPSCYICLAVIIIGGAACCCYVTHGFGGLWTYWPF